MLLIPNTKRLIAIMSISLLLFLLASPLSHLRLGINCSSLLITLKAQLCLGLNDFGILFAPLLRADMLFFFKDVAKVRYRAKA